MCESDVTIKHFERSAADIGFHGDNDTLPFDVDNRFIKDKQKDLAKMAFDFFSSIDKKSEKDVEFFKKISNAIGCHPSVFYSIIKILNGIGSDFANDVVIWINDIVQNNDMLNKTLETDTIY